MFISLTRLRVNGWRKLPQFLRLSKGSIDQAIADPHCLSGATYLGPGLTFWTATVWKDAESAMKYVRSGAHLKAMPWLARDCSEGATSHFTSDDGALPTRWEIRSRLAAQPKFFKVEHPTLAHTASEIPAPSPWLRQVFKRDSL